MSSFKESLKRYRLEHKLSQAELAEQLGLSTSAISMYEVGKREPDFETEEKIADFFGVDLDTLRGRKDGKIEYSVDGDISIEYSRKSKDVKSILAYAEKLLSQDGVTFDGNPASQEAIESILSAIQIGAEIAKRKNDKK